MGPQVFANRAAVAGPRILTLRAGRTSTSTAGRQRTGETSTSAGLSPSVSRSRLLVAPGLQRSATEGYVLQLAPAEVVLNILSYFDPLRGLLLCGFSVRFRGGSILFLRSVESLTEVLHRRAAAR